MTSKVHLGISTCPNDTFLFHALLAGEVDTRGFEFEIELLDVQALNDRLVRGNFDAAKGSFYAALELSETLGVLDCGAALGYGVGPLLLARTGLAAPAEARRILCPGRLTTANLLFGLFHSALPKPEQVVFSEIMPALTRGEADLGVCIHEGRFTYEQAGLTCVEDLGTRWEEATGAPLPLGGIFVRKERGEEFARELNACLAESLAWARANPEATLPTMRRYAQELSDEVIWSHVELYVSERTASLGDEGRRALEALSREAVRSGLIANASGELAIYGP